VDLINIADPDGESGAWSPPPIRPVWHGPHITVYTVYTVMKEAAMAATRSPTPKTTTTKKAAPKAKTAPQAKAAAPAARKPVRKARPTATPAPSPAPVEAAVKPKKLVRDSFTIPRAEYAVIDVLKKRVATAGRSAKKSELLRAGLMALSAMDDAALLLAVDAVPAIKTGRPKAKKASVG